MNVGNPDPTPFVWLDMVVFGSVCNLRCAYCRGFHPREPLQDVPGGERHRFEKTLARLSNVTDTPILKLSGGELFMRKEAPEIIRWAAARFPLVQVLSNGVQLSRQHLDDLKGLGNVHLQLSLDGHTPETNRARSANPLITSRILSALEHAVCIGLAVEINCVLTRYNTGSLASFADYLANLPGPGPRPTLFPRPVRGAPRDTLAATLPQIQAFESFAMQYARRPELPPSPYLERVAEILRGPRVRPCYIPFFVLGAEACGDIRACTVGGMPMVGNVRKGSQTIRQLRDKRHYSPRETYHPCSDCINQYELANMLVDRVVSRDSLRQVPLLAHPQVSDSMVRVAGMVARQHPPGSPWDLTVETVPGLKSPSR